MTWEVIKGLIGRKDDRTAEIAGLIQEGRFEEALALEKAVADDEFLETMRSAKREVEELILRHLYRNDSK